MKVSRCKWIGLLHQYYEACKYSSSRFQKLIFKRWQKAIGWLEDGRMLWKGCITTSVFVSQIVPGHVGGRDCFRPRRVFTLIRHQLVTFWPNFADYKKGFAWIYSKIRNSFYTGKRYISFEVTYQCVDWFDVTYKSRRLPFNVKSMHSAMISSPKIFTNVVVWSCVCK